MNADYKKQLKNSSFKFFSLSEPSTKCEEYTTIIKKYCNDIQLENDIELRRTIFYNIGGIIQQSPKLEIGFIQEIGILNLIYLHLQTDFDEFFEIFVKLIIELILNNKEIINIFISTHLFRIMILEPNYKNEFVQILLVQMVSYNMEITNILIEQYNICELIIDKKQIPKFFSNLLYTCDENDIHLVNEAIINIISDINLVDDTHEIESRFNSLNHIFHKNGKFIILILENPMFKNILQILNSNNPCFIFKVLTLFRVFVNSNEEEVLSKFCSIVPLQTFFNFIKYDSDKISQTAFAIVSDIIAEKIYTIDDILNMNLVEIIDIIFANGTFNQKKYALDCLINLSLYFRGGSVDVFNCLMPKNSFDNLIDFIISKDCLRDPTISYGIFHIFSHIDINTIVSSSQFPDFHEYLQSILSDEHSVCRDIQRAAAQLSDLFAQYFAVHE